MENGGKASEAHNTNPLSEPLSLNRTHDFTVLPVFVGQEQELRCMNQSDVKRMCVCTSA